MKRLSALMCTILIFMCVVLIPVQVEAAGSGNTAVTQPTKEQIALQYLKVKSYSSLYKKTPSVDSPYSPGELLQNVYDYYINQLNYIRYVAKLPELALDDDLNLTAQHGAVLMAADGEFSHYPSQPSDMPDDFYRRGYQATSSSNIAFCAGYGVTSVVPIAIMGCMDDSDYSNAAVVGHRRWFLNPTLKYTGIGVANNGGSYFTDMMVWDRSGEDIDYDYVSWPASGNMPTNLFSWEVPWSVSYNSSKYTVPSRDALKITITRKSDGKTWTFDKNTPELHSGTDAYMRVDYAGYGGGPCIIFRPDFSVMEKLNGVYTVKITGLQKRSDYSAATIAYNVDFFDVDAYKDLILTQQPQDAVAGKDETIKVSVKVEGKGLKYQWYYKDKGSKTFTLSTTVTGPNYITKMNKARSGRQLYCVISNAAGKSVTTDTVTIAMLDILKEPADAVAKSGTEAKTVVNAVGDGLKYQWYVKLPGKTDYSKSSITKATYSTKITNAKSGALVYCVITDAYGNKIQSEPATLAVPAAITGDISDVKAHEGWTAEVKVTAVGEDLTYQWYYQNPKANRFLVAKNFTSDTYSVEMNEARHGRKVYCLVTDRWGNTAKSSVATLNLTDETMIVTEPQDVFARLGAAAKTTVTAAGKNLQYQWFVKNPGQTEFTKSSVKSNTYGCMMSAENSGRQVYCEITDAKGNVTRTRTATLRMKVTITEDITDQSEAYGDNAKVTVEAVGDGLTYKWYYKNPGSSKFTLTKTFTGPSYTAEMNDDRDGRQVYCVITDKWGNSVQTKTATLSLYRGVTITKQPQAAYAQLGETVTFTIEAQGKGLEYDWYVQESGRDGYYYWTASGSNTFSLVITEEYSSRRVLCVVTDSVGYYRYSATPAMYLTATITEDIEDVTAASGNEASVTVGAVGDELTYKWYYRNPGADRFIHTKTFTGPTYAVEMNKSRHGRQVYCEITDKYGYTVTTSVVTLKMK